MAPGYSTRSLRGIRLVYLGFTAAFLLPVVQEKRGHVPAVQSRAAPWTAAARRRFGFTPGWPRGANRFIHLCGSRREADCPSSAVLRRVESPRSRRFRLRRAGLL